MRYVAHGVVAGLLIFGGSWAEAHADSPPVPEAFKRCTSCHTVDPAKQSIGPHLVGIVGRQAGAAGRAGPGTQAHAPLLKALIDQGIVWDEATLSELLSGPLFAGQNVRGNDRFRVIKNDPVAIEEIINYLETVK